MNAVMPTVTLREVARAQGVTVRAVQKRAKRENWTLFRPGCIALPDLPEDAQTAVLSALPADMTDEGATDGAAVAAADAWAAFNEASDARKAIARRRLAALAEVDDLRRRGMGLSAARHAVAARSRAEGMRDISVSSLKRWAAAIEGVRRKDWLALLLPAKPGKPRDRARCDDLCWDWYKGHFLSRSQPSHAETYRRVVEIAKAKGYAVPSEDTLRRRMDAEVPLAVQIAKREGAQALARILPSRERDASVFACGQAVNGDGLKFDRLWVRFPDGEVINTATGWFWQDLRSRKVLAWRLDKTENTDLFRLATYDLTGVCAPEHVYLDNTRVAANKVMTAGNGNRHRFKHDPEDGMGLLAMLGMHVHFTNPDKESGNPGAKPIERAFGIGGLHDKVATHPMLEGKGHSKATAIDAALLAEIVAIEVARHNAQSGRRTAECGGILSFDDVWRDGLAARPPQVYTKAQRQLLLMSREVVTIRQDGGIVLAAGRSRHGRNRYWCEQACQFIGQKVAVHFDPANLSDDVHAYSLDGRYLFAAQHLAARAFNDTESARQDAKWKRRQIKAIKAAGDAAALRDAQERAKIYGEATAAPAPGPQRDTDASSAVVAGRFQRPVQPARDAEREAHRLARTGTDDAAAARVTGLDEFLKRVQEAQIERDAWKLEGTQ